LLQAAAAAANATNAAQRDLHLLGEDAQLKPRRKAAQRAATRRAADLAAKQKQVKYDETKKQTATAAREAQQASDLNLHSRGGSSLTGLPATVLVDTGLLQPALV
jgi:hypothetical protein